MKLLIVTYWYAPARHPRAFRWSALAAHWASRGDHVEVVSHWAPGLPREETLDGVVVHRTGGGVIGRLRARFGRSGREEAPDAASPPGFASRALRRLNDSAWRGIWWPDYACPWLAAAEHEAGRRLAEGGFRALVTVSDPFTDHLAGLGLHRLFPGLPWVADIGDPFSIQEVTPVNNLRLYRRRNRLAEARVLERAAGAAVTAPGVLEAYREAFPASAGKIRVIPPLLSPLPPGEKVQRVFPEDGKARLVFVGTLYRKVRSPQALLELFRSLAGGPLGERLELHFFGRVNDCGDLFAPYGEDIGRRIFLHGMVPRGAALRAMEEAWCLVNIGNATPYQLPSKVVEYAAAPRPILNLAGAPNDSSAAFLAGRPGVLNLGPGALAGRAAPPPEVARFLESPPAVDAAVLRAWLAPFGVAAAAAAYEKLFEENVNER